MPKAPSSAPVSTVDTKLEEILVHLRRMDKRDRLRTWGGFFKGLLGLIPIIAFVAGLWYFYYHGDELLSKVAEEAAKQAAAVTEKGASNMMEQFQKYLPK